MAFGMINYRVLGLEATIKKLQATDREARGAVAAAIYQLGLDLIRKSARLVPVDQGTLDSSHYVSPPTAISGSDPSCEVGYGTDYAEPVHERTEVQHKHGRKAKFLSEPFDELKKDYVNKVGEQAKKNLERGIGAAVVTGFPTVPKSTSKARRSARKSVGGK